MPVTAKYSNIKKRGKINITCLHTAHVVPSKCQTLNCGINTMCVARKVHSYPYFWRKNTVLTLLFHVVNPSIFWTLGWNHRSSIFTCFVFYLLLFCVGVLGHTRRVRWVKFLPSVKLRNGYVHKKMLREPPSTKWMSSFGWIIPLKCAMMTFV